MECKDKIFVIAPDTTVRPDILVQHIHDHRHVHHHHDIQREVEATHIRRDFLKPGNRPAHARLPARKLWRILFRRLSKVTRHDTRC